MEKRKKERQKEKEKKEKESKKETKGGERAKTKRFLKILYKQVSNYSDTNNSDERHWPILEIYIYIYHPAVILCD